MEEFTRPGVLTLFPRHRDPAHDIATGRQSAFRSLDSTKFVKFSNWHQKASISAGKVFLTSKQTWFLCEVFSINFIQVFWIKRPSPLPLPTAGLLFPWSLKTGPSHYDGCKPVLWLSRPIASCHALVAFNTFDSIKLSPLLLPPPPLSFLPLLLPGLKKNQTKWGFPPCFSPLSPRRHMRQKYREPVSVKPSIARRIAVGNYNLEQWNDSVLFALVNCLIALKLSEFHTWVWGKGVCLRHT